MEGFYNAIAVQRMQEYIEKNLFEPITMKQLSNVAGYSPWHASRIFKEETGKTPFEYIRSYRLTKAALLLRENKMKVVDVALEFVFDSHEGFTRAFSKEFGMVPSKYIKNTPPINLFIPFMVYDTYYAINKGDEKMDKKEKAKTIFVQVIDRPRRKVLLKRGKEATEYFKYFEETGCDVWAVLTSVKEALYEPIGMWLPKHLIAEGTSKYVQGVEVPITYANIVPEGFEIIELPPCKMMVFQGEPYNDQNFMEEITSVWEHIDMFNPNLYGYDWDDEVAPRFQLIPLGERGYIEARPVKEIK